MIVDNDAYSAAEHIHMSQWYVGEESSYLASAMLPACCIGDTYTIVGVRFCRCAASAAAAAAGGDAAAAAAASASAAASVAVTAAIAAAAATGTLTLWALILYRDHYTHVPDLETLPPIPGGPAGHTSNLHEYWGCSAK